jgi:hypothetical protein
MQENSRHESKFVLWSGTAHWEERHRDAEAKLFVPARGLPRSWLVPAASQMKAVIELKELPSGLRALDSAPIQRVGGL